MQTTRRELLAGMTLSSAATLLSRSAAAESSIAAGGQSDEPPAAAYRGQHKSLPLPFDPRSLNGLSEKLILSHHENNYGGAVRNLNKVEAALASITKDSPPFLVAALKERELTFSNSVALHELYFANLGGGGKPAGDVAGAISAAYGTLARWEEEFRATAAGLAGGSGWVLLALDLETKELRTHGAGNHTQAKARSLPVLVMDMYEHSYQMDYGAAAAKYIEAFFGNVNWQEVERRLARGLRAAAELAK